MDRDKARRVTAATTSARRAKGAQLEQQLKRRRRGVQDEPEAEAAEHVLGLGTEVRVEAEDAEDELKMEEEQQEEHVHGPKNVLTVRKSGNRKEFVSPFKDLDDPNEFPGGLKDTFVSTLYGRHIDICVWDDVVSY
jgi:hypothetical protein